MQVEAIVTAGATVAVTQAAATVTLEAVAVIVVVAVAAAVTKLIGTVPWQQPLNL